MASKSGRPAAVRARPGLPRGCAFPAPRRPAIGAGKDRPAWGMERKMRRTLFPPELFVQQLLGEFARSIRRGYTVSLVALCADFAPSVGADVRAKAHAAMEAEICDHLREFDQASFLEGRTFLVLLPETPEMTVPVVSERLRESVSRLLEGSAEVRIALRTYQFEAKQEKPEPAWLKAELRSLLNEVALSPAR